MKAKTILKLSELPDDVEVSREYIHTTYTVAELKREILVLKEPHHEQKGWAVISREKWYPDAKYMIESYIDNEADDLYEDADESLRNGIGTDDVIAAVKAVLDAAMPDGLDYWTFGKDVEIDIFPPTLKLSELRPFQYLNYNGEIYTKEQVIALIQSDQYAPTQRLTTVSDNYIQRALLDASASYKRGEVVGDFCEHDPDAELVEVDVIPVEQESQL